MLLDMCAKATSSCGRQEAGRLEILADTFGHHLWSKEGGGPLTEVPLPVQGGTRESPQEQNYGGLEGEGDEVGSWSSEEFDGFLSSLGFLPGPDGQRGVVGSQAGVAGGDDEEFLMPTW